MAKDFYSMILKDFQLKDNDIVNVYPFGSKIYQTDSYKSDWDFIVLLKDGIPIKNNRLKSNNQLNVNLFSETEFNNSLKKHRMSSLECIFLPEEKLLKNSKKIPFNLDLDKLRVYAIDKSQEDWGKAKRAFSNNSHDMIKSVFHAFRTLEFAKQIIDNKKIVDYSSANNYLSELNSFKDEGLLFDEEILCYYEEDFYLLLKEFL